MLATRAAMAARRLARMSAADCEAAAPAAVAEPCWRCGLALVTIVQRARRRAGARAAQAGWARELCRLIVPDRRQLRLR